MQNSSNNSQVLLCAVMGSAVKSQAASLWSSADMLYATAVTYRMNCHAIT